MTATAQIPAQKRQCLGGAVKAIRKAHGIKQDTLAQACGVDPAYVSRIENGDRQPSMPVLLKLAEALDVSIDSISYQANVYVIADTSEQVPA